VAVSGYGAAADHASLSGLPLGDPHTQYALSTFGTLATRPAQPVRAGARYFATDTLAEYLSDGLTWQQITVPAVTRRYADRFLIGGS
jgi:hypothetical protein